MEDFAKVSYLDGILSLLDIKTVDFAVIIPISIHYFFSRVGRDDEILVLCIIYVIVVKIGNKIDEFLIFTSS